MLGHTTPSTVDDTSGCQSLHFRSLVLTYSIMSQVIYYYYYVPKK